MFSRDLFSSGLFFNPLFYLFSVVAIMIQIFICFKAKNKFIKALPCIITFVSSIGFSISAYYHDGWDAFGYGAISNISLLFFLSFFFGLVISWIVKKKTLI